MRFFFHQSKIPISELLLRPVPHLLPDQLPDAVPGDLLAKYDPASDLLVVGHLLIHVLHQLLL